MVEISIPESNARAEALGRFVRWLNRRYQKLDLVEIANITDPIELRQIFVPMRVGKQDIPDEQMGRDVHNIREEKLPGEDAWDLLIREPFVLLSGRPGSGKTTLVQAVIAELCGEGPSRLREETQAVPVPLILRSLGNLDGVQDLQGLLDLWWPLQEKQAAYDKMPLDLPRLKERLFPKKGSSEIPVLLLFDGIDEIGGRDVRQRLMDIACGTLERGYRVLVTGRPTGYQDLQFPLHFVFQKSNPEIASSESGLTHLLPFAWPQIEQFIGAWYLLRDEWQSQREQGIQRFLGHLADRGRSHLLGLARRPIFLTLMSLVHCTQNQMPEGRPLLYKQIIDLYLDRQERHRQRERTVAGAPMPHWPAPETWLVLGHLAWNSQTRGAQAEQALDPEIRRVVWDRDEVVQTIRAQIEQRLGRFDVLTPEDATGLVDFFLHPAGLLVEPAEGKVQFAHLSFQEYLCAWFLHEQAKIEGMESLDESLFPYLREAGWDEVGLLLFCIHSDETGRQGHFKLLRRLDLVQAPQAQLLVNALTGRELPFSEEERRAWLPAAIACALVHPKRAFGEKLARVKEWTSDGLRWLTNLMETDCAKSLWVRLCQAPNSQDLRQARPPGLPRTLEDRWLQPPDDGSWDVFFGEREAQVWSFLGLVNDSSWVEAESALRPIADSSFEAALSRWLESRLVEEPSLFWWRGPENLPVATMASCELDRLVPDHGPLWQTVTTRIPLDGFLLQGEVSYEPTIFLTLHPGESLGWRNRLALTLYQAQVLVESTAEGQALYRSQSPSQLRSPSRMQSRKSRMQSLSQSLSLSRSRSLSRSLSLALLRLPSESLSKSLLQLLLPSLLPSQSLSQSSKALLDRFLSLSEENVKEQPEELLRAFLSYSLRSAALDWFSEQSSQPDLARRRGLHMGQPLPQEFGLFDEKGIPLAIQRREGWLKLGAWLRDDDAILAFAFPEGLPDADEKLLREDLAILHGQSWAPEKRVDVLLMDWPKAQEEREITLEAADRALLEACEKALADLEARTQRKKKKRKR